MIATTVKYEMGYGAFNRHNSECFIFHVMCWNYAHFCLNLLIGNKILVANPDKFFVNLLLTKINSA